MNKLPKISVGTITDADLAVIKDRNLAKAKAALQSFPMATRVRLAMKTGLPIEFISKNWDAINSSIMRIDEHEIAEKLIAQFLPLVDYVQGQLVPTQRLNAIKAALICAETVLKETSTPADENYWNKVTEYLMEIGK